VCVISAARSACRENLCRRLPGRLRSSEAAHRCSPRPIRPGIFHGRR
jgi:hypothetical protein